MTQESVRLFGLAESARRLDLSVHTIRQYVRLGVIRSVRVGRRRLISSKTLSQIIEHGLIVEKVKRM